MSFFRDCYLSIRGNLRECMTTPISRRKLLVFGGIFVVLVILVIILSVTLSGGGGGTSQAGRDALKTGVVGMAFNQWLKADYNYNIQANKEAISKKINQTIMVNIPAVMWPVGGTECSKADDMLIGTINDIDAANRLVRHFKSQLTIGSSSLDVQNAKELNHVALLLALNGGHTIDSSLAMLRIYYELGIRIMTLKGNCPVQWTNQTNGLTDFGETVVEESKMLGIILDLTQSSSATIEAVLKNNVSTIFIGVGAKSLTSADRNLDDSDLGKLTEHSNTLVLISVRCNFIKTTNCTMEDVVKHIMHIADKTKSREKVGLLMDFDDPEAKYPSGLENITKMGGLFDLLYKQHGWSMTDLEGLASKNLLNLLARTSSSAEPNDDPTAATTPPPTVTTVSSSTITPTVTTVSSSTTTPTATTVSSSINPHK